MRGRENISGASFLYSIGIIVIGFLVMLLVIDFFQITNYKESLDKDLKRSISYNLIQYLNDKHSSDRQAILKEEDKLYLQSSLKYSVENELADKYSSDFKIDSFYIVIEDNKVYVRYKATYLANQMLLRSVKIPIVGRSKAQRFDDK